jgi:hypothetical protein
MCSSSRVREAGKSVLAVSRKGLELNFDDRPFPGYSGVSSLPKFVTGQVLFFSHASGKLKFNANLSYIYLRNNEIREPKNARNVEN